MKRFLMFAFSAMILFVGCSKDSDNGIDNGGETTVRTSMGLTVTFPELNMTRATSDDAENATSDEVKVKDVTVFIFNPNGSVAPGNGAERSIGTDFDDKTNNVWSLKETSRIKTTSGPKKIYVAANLPEGFAATVTQENVLTQTATKFGGTLIAKLTSSDGIAMMSPVKEITLLAMTDADNLSEETPDANKFTTSIDRMVAKVAVSFASGTTSYTVSDITYAVDRFGVGQDGSAMYPVKWMNANKLITPYAFRMGAPGTTRIKDINPYNAVGKPKDLLHYFYAGENATEEGLRGEAAYASVRAKMTPSKYWKKDNQSVVEDAGAFSGDAYVVFHDNKYYFTKSESIAIDVAGALNAANLDLPPASYKLYSGHYCHYFVFLNRKENATDKGHLELHRNDFINILVNGVKGIGEPGDPNTGGETPGPEPTDPEIPVVSIPTMIEVTINVTPWNYSDPTVILE